MSRSVNKVILIGNLGADPEIRTTGGGVRVAQFSVATTRTWTDASGERQERTEWHRIVAWRKLADIAEKYLRKGERIYVEGEIQYRSYEGKDGEMKYITEIEARELTMLGGTGAGGEGRGTRLAGNRSRERQMAGAPAGGGGGGGAFDDFQAPGMDDDDDLPF